MAEPPRYPETEEDAGVGPDEGQDGGAARTTPRWVFVLGLIIAIVLVALMVVLHLTGTLGPGVH